MSLLVAASQQPACAGIERGARADLELKGIRQTRNHVERERDIQRVLDLRLDLGVDLALLGAQVLPAVREL